MYYNVTLRILITAGLYGKFSTTASHESAVFSSLHPRLISIFPNLFTLGHPAGCGVESAWPVIKVVFSKKQVPLVYFSWTPNWKAVSEESRRYLKSLPNARKLLMANKERLISPSSQSRSGLCFHNTGTGFAVEPCMKTSKLFVRV